MVAVKIPICDMSKSRVLTEKPHNWVEKVWRKNAPQIYKLCCARSMDTDQAKDLFQEVALRFCRSAESLDREKPIFPWFMTVIRNTHREIHRKNPLLQRQVPFMELFAHYSADKMTTEVQEGRRVMFVRRELDSLMENLSVHEKLAVEYSCIGGICAEEACVYCGIDKGTFFKRKATAFKKMREKGAYQLSLLKKEDSTCNNLEDLLTLASEFS